MPGMKRLRSPARLPYNQRLNWDYVASRESIAKRTLAPNPADIDPITRVPPWPTRLPRGLKKAASTPLVGTSAAALSPITERSTDATATSPNLSAAVSSDDGKQRCLKTEIVGGLYKPKGTPKDDISPTAVLKPKPLFHGQQRSFSNGTLPKLSDEPLKQSQDQKAAPQGFQNNSLPLVRMPRSSSLGGEPIGQPPNIPVPPLPFDLSTRTTLRKTLSPASMSPRRVSGYSLLSGDTSVLDRTLSGAFSQAETDFTSISLASPAAANSNSVGLGIFNGGNPMWNFSRLDRSNSPFSGSKAKDIRPQLNSQISFRGSIQDNPSKKESNLLPISLLNQDSQDSDGPPMTKEKVICRPSLKLPSGGTSRRPGLSPSSLPSRANVFQIHEDNKSKRASTSILQTVSGNQRSPVRNPWTDRPISIATDNPFRWDPKSNMQPGKPSALKGGARRHKRQSCVRISNIPVIIPPKVPYMYEGENSFPSPPPSPSPVSGLFRSQPLPRASSTDLSHPLPLLSPFAPLTMSPPTPNCLPSFHTFSPRIYDSPCQSPTQSPVSSSCSPTFHILPHYNCRTRSPSFTSLASTSSIPAALSTPTRNPSLRLTAGTNPNRRRAIFPNNTTTGPVCWPPLLSSSITPTDPPTTLFTDPMITSISDHEEETRNEERFSFRFPSPPSFPSPSFPLPPPPPRHPEHCVPMPAPRGPRAQPGVRSSFSSRHNRRQSVISKSRGGRRESPLQSLRKSVLELRRMNSEVSHSCFTAPSTSGAEGLSTGAHGHRRYLSLGKEIAESGEERTVRAVVKGPREMTTD
ncbi:MAG: hypothetical protein Q9190_000752 [Brigantiaea leucoxantha]